MSASRRKPPAARPGAKAARSARPPQSATAGAAESADDSRPLSAGHAFQLTAAFVAALLLLSQLPALDGRGMVRSSIIGAALLLFVWSALLFGVVGRRRQFRLEIALRPQHWLQACLQGLLILYWGYYWREVYSAAPLILAQILFVYAFDSLLSWTHRGRFILGFGPFPIIFSITLFFWFQDPFFYWQFAMVGIGLVAKEFLRWQRDGRNTHIFNPSSFPLAVVSAALLFFDATEMTWGFLVAETVFWPPHIYLVIFLIALPGQFLFGVAPMTLAAVTTAFGLSQLWFLATGNFWFVDAHVPIAVFLGMHLLFTDPATAPRTLVGRILFGTLYGLTTFLLYGLLVDTDNPGFYDKLLQVPLLNLSVILLDRIASSPRWKALDPSVWARNWAPRRRHLAYMGVWAMLFASMSASGYIGDRHPGQYIPFWDEACRQDRHEAACLNLYFLHEGFCTIGSAWSCNEIGILLADRYDNRPRAADAFARACTLGSGAGCDNARGVRRDGQFREQAPATDDYWYLVRGSKGPLAASATVEALHARACEIGWREACGGPGDG